MAPSLAFVCKIISTFSNQNPQFFFIHALKDACSAPLTIAREKQTLNPFHLKWS